MKRRILSKTTSFHPLFITIKKKPETVSFWTAAWVFFFPWMRKAGEEEDCYSSVFHRLFFQKDADQGPLLAQSFPRVGEKGGEVSLGWCRGGCKGAAPTTLPLCHWLGRGSRSSFLPCFAYKYKGERRQGTRRKRRERTIKKIRKKREREEEKQKRKIHKKREKE